MCNLYKLIVEWKDQKDEIFLFEEDLIDELSEKYLGSFYEGQGIHFPKATVRIFESQPGDEDNYPWLDFLNLKKLFEYLSEE